MIPDPGMEVFDKDGSIINTTEPQVVVERLNITAEVAVYRWVNGRVRKVAFVEVPEMGLLASDREGDPDAWGAQVERYVADCEAKAKAAYQKEKEKP